MIFQRRDENDSHKYWPLHWDTIMVLFWGTTNHQRIIYRRFNANYVSVVNFESLMVVGEKFRNDYKVPDYFIRDVELTFKIFDKYTQVGFTFGAGLRTAVALETEQLHGLLLNFWPGFVEIPGRTRRHHWRCSKPAIGCRRFRYQRTMHRRKCTVLQVRSRCPIVDACLIGVRVQRLLLGGRKCSPNLRAVARWIYLSIGCHAGARGVNFRIRWVNRP